MEQLRELARIVKPSNDAPRWYDEADTEAGQSIFAEHCAICHGNNGEGAADWRTRGPDGKFLPPPLNGSGHTWHHPLETLTQIIKVGSPAGTGNMPAWQETLTDAQIRAVLAWIQSWWPDEVYAIWYDIDKSAQ